jgi:hypothetical protein
MCCITSLIAYVVVVDGSFAGCPDSSVGLAYCDGNVGVLGSTPDPALHFSALYDNGVGSKRQRGDCLVVQEGEECSGCGRVVHRVPG